MEGINSIAIELCIIRIRQKMVNKNMCFSILNNILKDIHYRKGTPTQIYEEIINYAEITNDNTRKLNPQKIKWIEEWAKMKENELLPFVDRFRLTSTNETLRDYLNRRNKGESPVVDGIIHIPKKQNLPEVLNTQQAKEYFSKAIKAGFMDDRFQWVKGTTKYQIALFAEICSEKLKIKHKWKTFETLWNVAHLAQTRRESKERFGKVDREKEIIKIFE